MNSSSTLKPFSNPIREIIPKRYSCRTYVRTAIDGQTQSLLRAMIAAQRQGPLGGWARFELTAGEEGDLSELKGLGTYGFISGATGYIVGATSQDARHLEDFGYLMEAIILYATDLGLGTCWLGGTFTKTSFGHKIAVSKDELVPSVVSVGYIAPKPRRLERLIRRGAHGDRRLAWDKLFFEGDYGTPLSREATDGYATALEMLRKAPSASNKQPWRVVKDGKRWHFFLQRTPGYREGRLVRLTTVADLQRIDMGIAMCHFELTAREVGREGRWVVEKPEIEGVNEMSEYTVSWEENKKP